MPLISQIITLYYQHKFHSFGTSSKMLGLPDHLESPQNISIKKHVTLGKNLHLTAQNSQIHLLDNSSLMRNCTLYARENSTITVGKHSYINHHTELTVASGQITIGNKVLIGMHCLIIASTYPIDNISGHIIDQPTQTSDITIKEGAWIGAKCIILPGVTIGRRAVIGAGSVVTQDIPDNAIAFGSPAKVHRYRQI